MGKRKQTTEQRQKQVISRLINSNKELREERELLKEKLAIKDQALEDVMMRLAELEEMIFGKKKGDGEDGNKGNSGANGAGKTDKPKRNKSSYTRPTPGKDEVTDIEEHNINDCPDCGTKLTRKEFIVRYIEDIQLTCVDALDKKKRNKKNKESNQAKDRKRILP